MNVETYSVPVPMESEAVVIIDVLRATTMACALFDAGITELVMVSTIEEALEWKKKGYITAGERGAVKIKGFDLGNSPTELLDIDIRSKIKDKPVVMTTSNGTRAVNVVKAQIKILASLNNLTAVTDFLKNKHFNRIALVCAGTQSEMSLEDFYCAGLIVANLTEGGEDVLLDDASFIAKILTETIQPFDLRRSTHAVKLIEKGFEKDVDHALRIDTSSVVPVSTSKNVFHALYKV